MSLEKDTQKEEAGNASSASLRKRSQGPQLYLKDAQMKEIDEVYALFDKDGTGKMDVKHLKVALRAFGFDPKQEDLCKLLAGLDKPNARTISKKEFADIMTTKLREYSKKDEISRAFKLFDDDNTGKISFKNLKRVAQELGEHLEDEELMEMIQEADLDGDDEVNEQEFARIMRKISLF